MTPEEGHRLAHVLYALKRLEWGGITGTRCPNCGRQKAYRSHVCSCPTAIAWKQVAALGLPIPVLTVGDVPSEAVEPHQEPARSRPA